MDAWSSQPIPSEYLRGRTALERRGALVFQAKQCHNCHSLDDKGGQRGPALDSVALRLTEDQLIRQVIQGGGNMPAYGKNLSPAETTALVAFLKTLHPASQPPARNASQAVAARRKRGLTTIDLAISEFHAQMLSRLVVLAITFTLVDHSIGLFAWLGFSSKCFPKLDPRVAARQRLCVASSQCGLS